MEKGRSPECVDGVVGGTRKAGGVNVMWAEMRRRSPGSRRRVVAMSGRETRERRRDRSDLVGLAARGGGPPRSEASSPELGALIGLTPYAAR